MSRIRSAVERILVVDDEEAIRKVLRVKLEQEGYRVSVAAEGREAIKILQDEPFDLVIIDIMMPKKGGIDTIMELHQDFPDLKIIAMSGKVCTDTGPFRSLVQQFGVRRVLSKPFGAEVLLKTVREVLQG